MKWLTPISISQNSGKTLVLAVLPLVAALLRVIVGVGSLRGLFPLKFVGSEKRTEREIEDILSL